VGFSGANDPFEDPVLLSDPLDIVELREDSDSDDALSDLVTVTDLTSGTATTRCFFAGWLQSSCRKMSAMASSLKHLPRLETNLAPP